MPAARVETPSAFQAFLQAVRRFGVWCSQNPIQALLLLSIIATATYYLGFAKLFINGEQSAFGWANTAWNPEGSQEHGRLVPFIALGLLWFHRKKLSEASKDPSNMGLLFIGLGVLLFVLSARVLQPRMALVSVPLLVFGSAMFLWGRQVARIILFPCVFLFFMIPMNMIEQQTANLQLGVADSVSFLSNMVGIPVDLNGVMVLARDGSFQFEIAGGCSGIRSLTAMMMLTAVYVHVTQRQLWKKVTIFCMAIVFAIIGNIARVFTVILVARFIDPKLAGGIYHDYSGFIFFPFALAAMIGFSKLLNVNYAKALPASVSSQSSDERKRQRQYDY